MKMNNNIIHNHTTYLTKKRNFIIYSHIYYKISFFFINNIIESVDDNIIMSKYNNNQEKVDHHSFVIFNYKTPYKYNTWTNFVNDLHAYSHRLISLNYQTPYYNNEDLQKNNILVFFDFIDREFGWNSSKMESIYPEGVPFNWGGIIHHPLELDEDWGPNSSLKNYITPSSYIQKCFTKCKFLIVLSESLKKSIIESNILGNFNIPIYVIYHILPSYQINHLHLTPPNVDSIKHLLFLGWSFRNYSLFYKINAFHLKKIILLGVTNNEQKSRISKNIRRQLYPLLPLKENVEIINYLPEEKFLRILFKSIVFLDFDGVSANNSVVECIKYNIPLLIRKCEATIFYLGKDYPLYFDNEDDIIMKMNNYSESILSAIYYLENMDKTHLTTTKNIIEILNIIDTHH